MGDRAVYCARLESVCAERHRGFESPPIRPCFALALRRTEPSFARNRTSSEALAKEVGSSLYYVYLIESLSTEGQRYIGITGDLKQRLREHNAGESSHTSKSKPWKLAGYI